MIPTCGIPHVGSLIQCMERLQEGEIARIDCLLEVEDSLIYVPKLVCQVFHRDTKIHLTLLSYLIFRKASVACCDRKSNIFSSRSHVLETPSRGGNARVLWWFRSSNIQSRMYSQAS